MADDFTAQVNAWVAATVERQEAVFKESAGRVIEAMQERVPVDTGFLRGSMQVAINQPLPAADKKDGPGASFAPTYAATIANATIGDFITAGYSAVYGPRLEYGFVGKDSLGRDINQPPRGWVRMAAAMWPDIVKQVSAEAEARAKRG